MDGGTKPFYDIFQRYFFRVFRFCDGNDCWLVREVQARGFAGEKENAEKSTHIAERCWNRGERATA